MPADGFRTVSIREELYERLETHALDKRSRPGTEANRIIKDYLNGDLSDPEDAVRAGEADAAAIDRVQALMEDVMNPIEASNAMDHVREGVES